LDKLNGTNATNTVTGGNFIWKDIDTLGTSRTELRIHNLTSITGSQIKNN